MDRKDFESLREGNRLEAKDARGGLPRSMWETYSAFANTAGGIILLGVEELPDHSLRVVGLKNPEKMVDDLWNALNNPQKASSNILSENDVVVRREGDRDIVVINVPRADRRVKPVFVNKQSPFGHLPSQQKRRLPLQLRRNSIDDARRLVRKPRYEGR